MINLFFTNIPEKKIVSKDSEKGQMPVLNHGV